MEERFPVFIGFLIAIGALQLCLILLMFYRGRKARREAGNLLIPAVRLCFGRRPPSYWPVLALGFLAVAALMRDNLPMSVFFASVVLCLLPLVIWIRSKRGAGFLELRELGLILGGAKLICWSSVKRYRWHGAGPVQLNLYMPNHIANLPLSVKDQESVERVLREQIGTTQDYQLERLVIGNTSSSLQTG